MKIFRKCSFADAIGDIIPFYHDGIYHIFSLTPPPGATVYPMRLRTTWEHLTSKDLIHWEEQKTALCPGNGNEPDACGVWTGSVLFGEGKFHAFYTGHNYNISNQQTICHATSNDGTNWEKDTANPVISPKVDLYEQHDWRDPHVFFNEEDKCYWMLISARKKEGPIAKRGCIILYRSKDLIKWTYYGPLYEPYHTYCPECSEMFKIKDTWFLSYSRFSEFGNTVYRTSKSPFGPWRTPRMDGIGGRRFYAAKSMQNNEGRRFYFAWAHDRANESDTGDWYWGGQFCIPHEVCINDDNELDVKMPEEIESIFTKDVPVEFVPILGQIKTHGNDMIGIHSISTFSFGFIKINQEAFLFECKIRPTDCRDGFGLLLKSDTDVVSALILAFEPSFQRVSLLNMPMAVDPFCEASCTWLPKNPGPDGTRIAEKPFSFANGDTIAVNVIIDYDMVEIFIDNKAAFTYRSYERPKHELGLYAQDGDVEFYVLKLAYSP
jgi:beta-fructofuranosidase